MRKLILIMSVALVGFVCGPNEGIEWIIKTMSGHAKHWTMDKVWRAGAHLMGPRNLAGAEAHFFLPE
jgi:hypothetical protein